MTTAELTRKIGELEPQVSRNDERIKKNDERLHKVEEEQKEQRRLLIAVERIATGLDAVKEKVKFIGAAYGSFLNFCNICQRN